MIGHDNLYHYLTFCLDQYFSKPGKTYKIPLFTSLSFDLTVTSLFGALLCGGELVVYEQYGNVKDVLDDIFYGQYLNFLKCTPSHIGLLDMRKGAATLADQIIVGGEALQSRHVDTLRAICPSIEIYNEYGPTETTVGCVVADIDRDITIGRPIPGTQVYILDGHANPVPPGVTGELYIGGAGVAKGYWNREDLTRERFITNPFSNSGKLYRSGDLCRWQEDGKIVYLGRVDEQVKIHGHRVEPEEIAQVLRSHDAVQDAMVLLHAANGQEEELACYIKCSGALDAAAVSRYLAALLPDYMVPRSYMQVVDFPLTVNGKVDKQKLTEWYTAPAAAATPAHVPPANAVEMKLAEIWQAILDRKEPVGIKDSFFELGGNSIKAIRILSRVVKEFGLVIPTQKMFEYPTIEHLANHILNAQWLKEALPQASGEERERIRL